MDTNCNPDDVDYPIPANDDAIRAIRLVCSKIADAVIEGNTGTVPTDEGEEEIAGAVAEIPEITEPFIFTPDEEQGGEVWKSPSRWYGI